MASVGRILNGVGSVDITTDNIRLSTLFYTEVLGGKLLTQWTQTLKGDEHFRRTFGWEIEASKRKKVDLDTLGVPDISDTGSYQVQWNFILFDNFILKLVQYSSTNGDVFPARHDLSSAAIIPNPHLCFWVQDVDINKYIRALENAAAKGHFKNVAFNRTFYVETEGDRARVSEDQLANHVPEGAIAPLYMSYLKGPSCEQLEIFQLKDQLAVDWGKALADIGAPSTAYMTGYENNDTKRQIGLTADLYGMHHFGVRVADLERSIEFYTTVLGGVLLPFEGDGLRGDALFNVLFQKELLDARRRSRSRQDMDIPDLYATGSSFINLRFVQFQNATLELIEYRQGDQNTSSRYNPRFKETSPAYCNTMTLSFAVPEQSDFTKVLNDLQNDAAAKGFPEFHVNKPVTSENLDSFSGKDIEGYNYALAKGPSGEHIAFCQFSGRSRSFLHDEVAAYGGVSSLFPDLGGNS